MRKYYRIVAIIMLLMVIGVFFVLHQFQSEDNTISDYAVYEMNDNWSVVSVSPVMKQLENGGEEPDFKMEEPDAIGTEKEIGASISLPYEGTSEPGEMIVFQNTVPREYSGLTLSFYSTESTVRVSLNDQVIYQYGVENQRMFGKSPGSRINFVDLPDQIDDGSLRIEFTSSYEDAAATLGGMTVSQRDTAILRLIKTNLINLCCAIVILMTAVIFFILEFVCVRISQNTYGVFWLAALGIDAGLYYLVKTEILSIFYGAKAVYSIGQYLFIMLIPIFLLLYLGKNLEKLFPKFFMVLFAAAHLNVFLQLGLQVANICDLADMTEYTALLFLLVVVSSIILYVREAVVCGEKAGWIMASVSVVLLIGELASLGATAADQVKERIEHSQYAMTLFLFTLAGYHIVRVTQDYKEEADQNARRALAASEAKSKFLANMSHEIRTPINAVLGMDEMILRDTKETKIREYATDIFTAGQALLSIINDILDLSKIESGKMEIVPANYDVSSMIHDLSNMAKLRAKKKELRFHVEVDREIPCTLYGDDVRIRQVLTNILTNAVKYTKEGDIWFRIRREKEEEQRVMLYFEIEDTGIGIKEEDLPKLFAEFERIEENRNRNIEGTGLGMSITLQLLQMMGSSLQVESVYGKGSKFSFYLEQDIVESKPIGDFEQNVQQLAADYTYTASFRAPDARVLVVDDNAINRKVFGKLLNQTQVQITEAESGLKCLELTKQEHFDIIFLDHMMPELDGIETLKRLRGDPENLCGGVPVIALTANAISGAKKRYLEAGFNDYLSKPIVSKKLEKMLWSFLPEELVKEAETVEDMQQPEEGQKPDLEQLPMVEGLDWNCAWLHLSGMDLLQSTVEAFYEQIPAAAEKLDACYQEIGTADGLGAYRIQVHAMKSLAATVGIFPLAGMAKILEDAARKEQPETIHSMHHIFITEWDSYREKLTGVFGIKAPEEKARMEDSSIICALLEMLRIAMQDMDIDEADEKMKMIDAYRYEDDVQRNVDLLKTAVENLDPEQAEACVQTLIDQLSGQEE